MSSQDLIRESREGDVVTLHFNDPERLNAMTRAMGEAFREQGYTMQEEMLFVRKLAMIRKTHFDIEIEKQKEKKQK